MPVFSYEWHFVLRTCVLDVFIVAKTPEQLQHVWWLVFLAVFMVANTQSFLCSTGVYYHKHLKETPINTRGVVAWVFLGQRTRLETRGVNTQHHLREKTGKETRIKWHHVLFWVTPGQNTGQNTEIKMGRKTNVISSCNYSPLFDFGMIYTNTYRCLLAVFQAKTPTGPSSAYQYMCT